MAKVTITTVPITPPPAEKRVLLDLSWDEAQLLSSLLGGTSDRTESRIGYKLYVNLVDAGIYSARGDSSAKVSTCCEHGVIRLWDNDRG
jgi:hypothetical protein